MADTTVNKQPLIGGDSENFMRLMSRALTRIEQVDNATVRANQSLNEYAKSFDELNSRLEKYVKLSSDIKTGRFNKITINEKVQTFSNNGRSRGGSSKSYSDFTDDANKYAREAKRVTNNLMDTIFKSIDSLGGRQARIVTSTFKKITSTVSDVKTLAQGAKAAQGMAKAQQATIATTGASTKALAGMSTAAVGATTVVAGVALVLTAMGAAGKYAYERNMEVNRSLMMMGDTANELTSSSSKTANKMIDIRNTWIRIGEDLAGVFEPVFNLIVDFVGTISKAVEAITSPLDKDKNRQFTSSDSKARWYTSQLEEISGIPESKSLPVIGSIASTAKQSGFDNTSAANLAIGTFDMALKKARQYGVEAEEVAKKLADAWTTGSDAAKEYGVVVDEQTLIGYMASRGIDIVNTQISDAMKQYYRYQLMQEQLNADSNDAMQNQIKQWKQLGMQIDATKQKLFSFDEVIQLSALNTEIPIVGTPNVSYITSDKDDGVITPIPVIPGGDGGGPSASPYPSTQPVEVPVVYVPENEYVLNPVPEPVEIPVVYVPENEHELNPVPEPVGVPVVYVPENEPALTPVPEPVTIPVSVPGLGLLGDLVYELGLVWGLLPLPVTVPVTVPGLETLPTLEELLNRIKGLATLPVTIPVKVPGLELAPQLLTYCMQLSAAPFLSTVLFTIPAISLAPTLLGYLLNIAKSWAAKVDISVAGMNLLQQAQAMLNNVLSLVQRAGQTLETGAHNAVSTVRDGISTAYNNAKTYVTGGSDAWTEAVKAEGYSVRDINTAKSMAKMNNENWDTLSSYEKTQYTKVANVINNNWVLTKKDGVEMYNSYKATGQVTSSKVEWFNDPTVNKVANASLKVAGVLGLAGATLLTGGLVAPLVAPAVTSWLSGLTGTAAAFGMATGGIGVKESTVRLFEGNKKEAVIPLESQQGINYLANAMKQAGVDNLGINGGVTVNLTLSGINIADNEAQWQRVGEKIAEVIEVQRQRRGELNYGSSF